MNKLWLTLTFATLWLFIGAGAVNAAVLSKTYDRTYQLENDYVAVTETITTGVTDPNFYVPYTSREVFTIFNPLIDDVKAAERINQTLPTIQVSENGISREFTTEVSGQDINVYVERLRNVTYSNSQTLKITYNSYSLSAKNGALYDVYIPSFDKDFPFNDDTTRRTFNTRTVIPKRFGELNLVVPPKDPQDGGDFWELNFTQQELTGNLSWIQIGTTQYYQFELIQPYSASSNIPLFYNTYQMLLPHSIDTATFTQSIIFTEISPTPDSVYRDSNGNLVGNFIVPANQNGSIVIKGIATSKRNLQVDIKNSGNLADIDDTILEANTSPAEFWETEAAQIQEIAAQLKGDKTSVYDILATTYQFVVDQINYDDVKRFGLNVRQGALNTLLQGSGVCMEYSDLFITLMRAQGVPARAAFGYGFDSRTSNGEDNAHQWAEVYIPNLNAWVSVDTTWGESGPAVIGGDLNHFYKFVASEDPNTPSPVEVSFVGGLENLNDESFQVSALASMPEVLGLSEEDLITTYPQKSELVLRFEGFIRGARLGIETLNIKVTQVMTEDLRIPFESVRPIKVAIVVAFGILVITVLTIQRKRKKIALPETSR
jgi:transglutaminase-like putative cysteine protease